MSKASLIWGQLVRRLSKEIDLDWYDLEDLPKRQLPGVCLPAYCSFKFPFPWSTKYIILRFTGLLAEIFVDGYSYDDRKYLDPQNKLYHKIPMQDPDSINQLTTALLDIKARVVETCHL